MALESALTRIRSSRSHVETIEVTLATGYQGADGGEFSRMLKAWQSQCNIIERNLVGMVDALQDTKQQHSTHQEATRQQIAAESSRSTVFDRLTG
ncbi:hypothetical protein [Streptomyces sp. NPDC020681]|uniref:hypothetical protein n=1 Tax=Streptomyces sp. NPDC020681 TaxID=3365083 RepID=UPI0037AE2C0A